MLHTVLLEATSHPYPPVFRGLLYEHALAAGKLRGTFVSGETESTAKCQGEHAEAVESNDPVVVECDEYALDISTFVLASLRLKPPIQRRLSAAEPLAIMPL